MRKMRTGLPVLAVSIALGGCGAPDITSLDPNTGPERTLVDVNGDTFLSSVYWDAGSPGEVNLPGGFLGASVFSVPGGSALGAHDVQLERNGTRGNTAAFTVTAAQPFGAPRLDRVSLVFANFDPPGQVNTWLYVQGANIDVGAEVQVNGAAQPTVAHKGLRNDLLGVQPASLNFPIYHYLALISAPGPRPVGSALTVRVQNADGQLSNSLTYTLPASAATLDRDGDDFPDDWEINGYDADGNGTIDVDFAALGADPLRPDVFLEVDVMQGLANPPGAAVFQSMTNAFAAAPVINPTTDPGINLILDTSGTVPFFQTLDLQGAHNPLAGFANFYTLKNANFNNASRGRVYHYCIWGNMRPNGSSGISDVAINAAGTDFSGPGDDCIVSFDDFPAAFQTARSGAETLMHEVGHNFQQRHGGGNHDTNTPVYSSVMSYSWQLRTGRNNAWRRARPIYAPFYYSQNAVVEVNGALPAAFGNVIDYSEGMGRTLNEASLNEPQGLYNNNGIDWNGDGDTLDVGVQADANLNGSNNQVLSDFPNWARLVFSGPRQNGQFGG